MGFNCGIVGLPNVGKSTLFNALTSSAAAQAANYPFCTIEPNVGRVGVPDSRLNKLAQLAKSAKIIPTQLEFVDIAGLVKGASKGEGLGNQFLGHIRSVDAICHVVRCFEGEVTHVDGSVNPIRDIETINTELLLADLESLEKRKDNLLKKSKIGDVDAKKLLPTFEAVLSHVQAGHPARSIKLPLNEQIYLHQLQLITAKPVVYVCNVEESAAAKGNDLAMKVMKLAQQEKALAVVISAEIEAQISVLQDARERAEYLDTIGLQETGLDRVIKAGYQLLELITFFTVGPKEAHAWTVRRGTKAPQAAGVIHSDFEKGFIRAETISYADYIACGGEVQAKEAGKMRLEGKDYVTQDGDIFHFRFNV
jgi:hypothetical protein